MFKVSLLKEGEIIGSTIENKKDAAQLVKTLKNLYIGPEYSVTCEQV